MLEAEADQLCQAQKHQRSVERQRYRSGHYQRNFHTKAGDVRLKVSKLKKFNFESAIIERCKRREISLVLWIRYRISTPRPNGIIIEMSLS